MWNFSQAKEGSKLKNFVKKFTWKRNPQTKKSPCEIFHKELKSQINLFFTLWKFSQASGSPNRFKFSCEKFHKEIVPRETILGWGQPDGGTQFCGEVFWIVTLYWNSARYSRPRAYITNLISRIKEACCRRRRREGDPPPPQAICKQTKSL